MPRCRPSADCRFCPDSIKAGAKLLAQNLYSYYKGDQPGQTPGILPGPPGSKNDEDGLLYYWWEAGAMWGTLIDYWRYTGDTTYNDEIQRSLLFQANPPHNNFQPPNYTISLGNDDQGFWGMAVMLAAESNFQNPPPSDAQWLALAQGVWNIQSSRWETADCNGGLRWQVPPTNRGYDYKNSISNGILFNMAARLARYTGNATYSHWAEKTWLWLKGVGYVVDGNVWDGGHIGLNCTDINKAQFSYNPAIMIQGLAFMYNNASNNSGENPLGCWTAADLD